MLGMSRLRPWLAPLVALASWTCASPPPDGRFELTIELVENGRPVPGLIRVRDARGRAIPLPPLLPRGLGLEAGHPSLEWYVVPGRAALRLPRERLSLEAFRGLETEISRVELGEGGGDRAFLQIPLQVFLNAAGRGWRGANTHLHLKEISRGEADR